MIEPGPMLASEALNALPTQVAVIDSGGVIVSVSDAWSRFARANGGAPGAGAYIGTNYLEVCRTAADGGDETASAALAGIESVLRGDRERFSHEYPCHAPGRERWFRMSATRFMTGSGFFVVLAHDEITTQKEHERGLEESGRLLGSVLDTLPVGVWILDPDGRIVRGNPAGLQIWGGARYVGPEDFGQYKGWWVRTGQPIAADEWAAARAIRNGDTSIDEEVEIECFDGTHKIILNSAVPLRDGDGRIRGAIIVNQDITVRKRAEEEREAMLRELDRLHAAAEEANRMKDDFIATLSHELRTPLQSVLGWAAILTRPDSDAHARERAAAAIERNARISVQLLGDTLDVSRIRRGTLTLHKTDVDLDALVGEVCETVRPAAIDKGVALAHEAAGGAAAVVHGDPVRLQQVMWNLLSNALKFTPAGGRISVHTRPAGDWVEVVVRDTGEGIEPEFRPFLFDRYRQASGSARRWRPGLGLGLAIVKEVVELHGGTITADSAGAGLGATFTVRLPIAAGAGA